MRILREILKSGKRLFFDGAMGTMLQSRGLPPGAGPELFCLENPEILKQIHREYARAGADFLTTNTFGGNRLKLPAGTNVVEVNKRLTSLAREVADEEFSRSGRKLVVAGNIGPTGHFLKPLGDLSFEELVDVFREQTRGLIEGGADCLMIQTQIDISEARAAIFAARTLCQDMGMSLQDSIPIGVTMTFEGNRSLTGSTPEVFVATMCNMGVDFLGTNCSAGPKEIYNVATSVIANSTVPVIIQPNAGLPELVDGKTVFNLTPEEFADLTKEFGVLGAEILGGCCGTTPAHIAALYNAAKEIPLIPRQKVEGRISLTSRTNLVQVGLDLPFVCVGERINPTGKKQLTAELQAGEFTQAIKYAEEQIQADSKVLDVNVGAPQVDETHLLPSLVQRLSSQFNTPLCIDSSNISAIEAALKLYPASPLINSISAEEGKLERLGPLCRDLGAPFIFLPLKGRKLPETAKERINILEDFLKNAEKLGIPKELIIVDALVLAVSSKPEAAKSCLEFVRYCSQTLKLPTLMGLSNISFGLPARELINSSFLTLAAGAGSSACIANPSSSRIREVIAGTDLLLHKDPQAERFIERYSAWTAENNTLNLGNDNLKSPKVGPQNIFEAVVKGDKEATLRFLEEELKSGIEPYVLVNQKLIPAITEVGRKYEKKEYFLPQLLRSAEAMQAGFAKVKPLLEKESAHQARPRIVIATVEGDIHDIGKNIVQLMLSNHGFDVIDLGKDVKAKTIVERAKEENAAIIGLSALMTTTMVRMQETIDLLQKEALSIKVMIGGAVVTEHFAKSIGADGYSTDAVDAVRLAQKLLNIKN
ncbi:homocysteine S-methyltransferase family protein [Desulfovibrio litoralis]|uniref:Methionine synthase n=1 Tax=Desulfovibrio litoralis DSM 11393 TaxID=1121455 RepID=A0A1M7TBE8_9BACT|nr:homocysteine S-methyltransferase family protein [Desulfovibrio litoralis]SHN68023.1 methionine synthase (B12-dependent) [Desulfovibrio litoralis DSM 11393]